MRLQPLELALVVEVVVLTADNPAMFDDWPQLSSLLARALPTANVNFLYPEAEDAGEYSI